MALREGLSTEVGMAEIGVFTNQFQCEISPQLPFMELVRDYSSIYHQLFKRRIFLDEVLKKWQELPIEKNLERYAGELGLSLDSFPVSGGEITLVSISVWEAVINAVKYGSKFGKKGCVNITFSVGPHGIFILIHDHGSGFKFQGLLSETVPEKDLPIRAHNGLYRMMRSRESQVWFEKVCDGFETKILFTSKIA